MSTSTPNHTGRALYTGLTAAGSSQTTALQLAGRGDSIQEVTTAASSTGVMLPPVILPMRVEIANQGSNTLTIYPQVGGTIDNGTLNAGVTLGAGKAAIYEASSLTNWYTVSTTASSGGGSGTVSSGTAGQVTVYAASGTTVSGSASILQGANGQLNLPEQATPGTQVSGDRWTDSTQHCQAGFDGSATSADCLTAFRSGLIFEQITAVTVTGTGSAVSSTLVSTTNAIGKVALPAGYLNVAGRKLRLTGGGYYSTAGGGGGNYIIFVKLGSNVVATTLVFTGTYAGATNLPFRIDCTVATKTTGASGTLVANGNVTGIAAGALAQGEANMWPMMQGSTAGTTSTSVTLDLTAAYTLDLQLNVNQTGNSWTLNDLSVEVIG